MDDAATTPWLRFSDLENRLLSYAQNAEDVLLARIWKGQEHAGFYVDVGANHPIFHSVTKHFSDHGWRGINVEPNPTLHALLAEDRPRDLNLNMGVGDADSTLDFFECPEYHGWSTFVPGLAAHYRSLGVAVIDRAIPVRRLDAILEEHLPAETAIDFLKIDVEGFEPRVFAGLDLCRWRPRVIVVESNGRVAWEPQVIASGYRFGCFDGINCYYGREGDDAVAEALATPVNVLDNFLPYDQYRLLNQVAELDLGPRSYRVLRGLKRIARGRASLSRFARQVMGRAG